MNELILLIIFLLLTAAWNGYVLVWGLTKNVEIKRKANVMWHRIGWLIRAIPTAVMVYYYWGYFPDVLAVLAFAALFGHGFYNIIINLIRGKNWAYIGQEATGSVSWWDMLIKTKLGFKIIFALEIVFVIVVSLMQ